jgi:hypothetical protein
VQLAVLFPAARSLSFAHSVAQSYAGKPLLQCRRSPAMGCNECLGARGRCARSRQTGEERRQRGVFRGRRLHRVQRPEKARLGSGQIRRQQNRSMRQVCEWATLPAPSGSTVLPRGSHAMMCAVDAAAGWQQRLRPRQIERRCARNQQQHPGHQQVGDKPLHLCSLHGSNISRQRPLH